MRTLQFACIIIAMTLAACVVPSGAQPWPQRTVRIIVPIGAGVGSDIAARRFAEQLSALWGQPVVVENRPGADGLIGTVAFVNMHDDHTLLFSPAAPISVFPLVHETLAYDPARDLVPIASATNTAIALGVSESLNIASLPQLIAFARTHPGGLNWSSGGGALTYVLAGFAESEALDMVPVSYREQRLALQDLAAGRLHVMITVLAALLPQVDARKARFLAVTNSSRVPPVPDVPTAREAGSPKLEFDGLWGFFGRRDMPNELRDRIAADVRTVAANPILATRLAAVGQTAHAGTPAEFATAIEAQRVKIESIVKVTGANLMR
jgi:tripartite-type tricarboxylate transporter receptor subunit TctC